MLEKCLAILLVPLLAVGSVFAHVHCCAEQGSAGEVRAYFHLGAGPHRDACQQHEHEHEHEKQREQGHDSDAVYVPGALDVLLKSSDVELDGFAPSVSFAFEPCLPSSRALKRGSLAFQVKSGPPLFVLHAALRL